MKIRLGRKATGRMLLATVITIGCAEGAAQLILDQAYEPIPNWGLEITAGQAVAQTFTVGATGLLAQVELFANHHRGICSEELNVFLLMAIGGLPTPDVLALRTVSPSEVPLDLHSTVMVDFSSDLIGVEEGDTLGIVLRSDATGLDGGATFVWRADIGGTYPGGFASVSIRDSSWGGLRTDKDMGFRTYVDTSPIPEPNALPFLAIGAVFSIFFLRRR
jgi:hypothetical protein